MKVSHMYDMPDAPLEYDFDDRDYVEIAWRKWDLQSRELVDGALSDRYFDLTRPEDLEEIRKYFEEHDQEFQDEAEQIYIKQWEEAKKNDCPY